MLRVTVLCDDDPSTCDDVMEELENLKGDFPELRVRQAVIDQEPELVGRLGVVASPAIIVNDQLAFQGHPDQGRLATYFENVRAGLHDDPNAYPPENERDPEAKGQEATGSQDPEWRGSGRRPAFAGQNRGRHS